jgi:biopolymer transport protein ExbD
VTGLARMMLVIRGLVCLALALGAPGCNRTESSPFPGVSIELPRAAHAEPFPEDECVSIAIVHSASQADEAAEATILVESEKFELAKFVQARGAEEGRRELAKALAAAVKAEAAAREKPSNAGRSVSEANVRVYADRRVSAEHFVLLLSACARANVYKVAVVVAGDAAPGSMADRAALRCWLPRDNDGRRLRFNQQSRPVSLWELEIALAKKGTVTECTTAEVRSKSLPYDVPRRRPAKSGAPEEKKAVDARPAPRQFALIADTSPLAEEIGRAERAFGEELQKLAADGIEVPPLLREEGMSVTLNPAPEVAWQDVVTVLDVCASVGIKAISFRAPEGW